MAAQAIRLKLIFFIFGLGEMRAFWFYFHLLIFYFHFLSMLYSVFVSILIVLPIYQRVLIPRMGKTHR
jgi:hypothetical protein